MANVSKFNFQEIFSNDNGKSSGSGFAGVIICLVCSLSFLVGVVDKMWLSHTSDVMNASIGFASLGAALLGVRKFMQNKTVETPILDVPAEEPTEEVEGNTVVDNPDA